MLEEWMVSLPSSWAFKSYKQLPSKGATGDRARSTYHVYPDLLTAMMWNAYRSSRLMIQEMLLALNPADCSTDAIATPDGNSSTAVGQQLADAICASIPYFLSGTQDSSQMMSLLMSKWKASEWSSTGALLLLWPLFSCGMSSATDGERRVWIGTMLRNIGLRLGMELASAMANAVETHTA